MKQFRNFLLVAFGMFAAICAYGGLFAKNQEQLFMSGYCLVFSSACFLFIAKSKDYNGN